MKHLIWTHKKGDEGSLKSLLSRYSDQMKVHSLPVIQTSEIQVDEESFSKAKTLVSNAKEQTLLVISSKNTLDFLVKNEKLTFLKSLPVICVGKNTAKSCSDIGLKVLDHFNTTKDLSAHLSQINGIEHIIIAGAKQRASKLEEISNGKFNFVVLNLYVTDAYTSNSISEDLKKVLDSGNFSICFSSPSAVSSFRKQFQSFGVKQFAIGPTTAESIKAQGLSPIVSKEPTFESLIEIASETIA